MLECSPARAQAQDTQTQLWLARAGVAEAGWPKTDEIKIEQAAVWHSLSTRWDIYSHTVKNPVPFVEFVRLYCAGLGEGKPQTKRQRWIRELNWKGKRPSHWPKKVSWHRHIKLWFDTLKRAGRYLDGKIENPCPGASHFGSLEAGDRPKGKMKLHSCNYRFGNQFYTVVNAK